MNNEYVDHNNTDPVRALIAEWRESAADTKRYSASDYADGYAAAESNCANRLEAALALAPPSGLVGEVCIRLNGIGEGGPYPVVNGVCVLPQSVAENLVASTVGQQMKRELLAQWASYKQPAEAVAEVVEFYGLRVPSWIGTEAAPDLPVGTKLYTAAQLHAYARANTASLQAENERLLAEVSELRAARIAYANEFPATEDGDPDTGNIHANIRALKVRAERLRAEVDKRQALCEALTAALSSAEKSIERTRSLESASADLLAEALFNHPRAFGLMCTVAWTELVQALRQDGHQVNDSSGPNVRKWIESMVRDSLAAPQPPAAPSGAVNVVGMPEFDGLLDHIYEYGTAAEGVIERANAFARAVLARYAPQQPAGVGGTATNSAVAAIQFALKDPEGMTFLRLWNEGEFDTLRREWPDAPVEVYIDADPLAAQQQGGSDDV